MKNIPLKEAYNALKRRDLFDDNWFRMKCFADGEIDLSEEEAYSLIPIRLVAILEDSMRSQYAEIIDDRRYRKNVADFFTKTGKMDLELLEYLQDDVITLGEYLSYSFSCNKFEDIIYNLKVLLGVNIKSVLKDKMGECYDKDVKTIQKIFKERHELCHESNQTITYTKSMVRDYAEVICRFISNIQEAIYNILNPNEPITYQELEEDATKDLYEYNKELEECNNELDSLVKIINENIENIEYELYNLDFLPSWKEYRKNRAVTDSKQHEDESTQSLVYTLSMVKTTRSLIQELRQEYREVLRKADYTINDSFCKDKSH